MVMKQKKIEFVCTANCGRSVPSEIFANQYLAKLGKLGEYLAISSGSAVDAIQKKDYSIGLKQSLIKLGVEGNLYGEQRATAALIVQKENLEQDYNKHLHVRAAVDTLFEQALSVFEANEVNNRYKALKELGLEDKIKEKGEQTVPREDVVAILPMAKKNLELVRGIYQASEYELPSEFDVLKSYVTGNPADEVADGFGKGQKHYNSMIRELQEIVPPAVDKVLVNTK
ncbi:hypothetical protein ACFLZ7_01535 [Nanoarchaeota archaeon]